MGLYTIDPDRGPLKDDNATMEDIAKAMDILASHIKNHENTGDIRYLSACLGAQERMVCTFESFMRNVRKELLRARRGVRRSSQVVQRKSAITQRYG